MTTWWVTDAVAAGGVGFLSAWIIWVIVSITLHELAHGWAAISRGDNTPIETGHMTWNPVVHMGVPSLMVFALTGLAWGLMPVTPSRMRGRHADAFVSFAGPLMNLTLAAVCIIGTVVATVALSGKGSAPDPDLLRSLKLFFGIGCGLNVLLGLFNLLPAPPLDGSRVLASFFPQYRDSLRTQGGQFFGVVLFIIAFAFGGRVFGGVGMKSWSLGSGYLLQWLHGVGVGPGSPWVLP
jgi:Zn-dependent protease